MALDCESILQEQERLILLNQQLLAQVKALQNNPVQLEDNPENSRSPNLYTVNELIQKQIEGADYWVTLFQLPRSTNLPSSRRSKSVGFRKRSPLQHSVTTTE